MEYRITIIMDNAAFGDQGQEVARVLKFLAHHCDETNQALNLRLHDINGNYCGEAEVKES